MRKSIFILITSLVCLLEIQTVFAQEKAGKTTPTPIVPTQNYCFGITKPGAGGCPVGEDIPYGTPLLEAMRQRDIPEVKRLISEGANVNEADGRGVLPLLLAASGDLELIDILLEAHADVNLEGLYGAMPLGNSTMCSESVKKLLKAGADVNQRNNNKQTALILAVKNRNVESVKLLLDAGADVSAKDVEEMTPLLYAFKNNDMETVKMFSKKFDKKLLYDDEILSKALFFAIVNSQIETVKYLLDRGANPKGRDKYKYTPLGIAVQKDNIEIVKLLLSREAEVNLHTGYSPIYYASLHGNAEIVKLLLEAKADVDEPRLGNYWTPLIEAARNDHIEVMNLLIKAGADVNRRAYDGKTPLMYAVWVSKVDAVRLLIEKGADVNARDEDDNVTALSFVKERGSPNSDKQNEILQMLIKAGAVE